jgi:peptide/nickel transport system permease protein
MPSGPSHYHALRALLRDPMGMMGLVLVMLFIVIALFAPWISPRDPLKINIASKFALPGSEHFAGADQLGRDLLSRIFYGTRTAMGVALVSTGIAGFLGLVLGLIAGYGPRWLDSILVIIFDSLSSLPTVMFALAVITVLGPGIETLVLVIILISVPAYARFVRAQTLGLARSEFIEAERVMGASHARIVFLHLLPNVAGQLVIVLSMDVPTVIMLEAGLSYLGLGVRPPTPSWGNILYDGYTSLRQAPLMVVIAGLPLVLATLGFTFLGEGLRDALDPKLQVRGMR